MVRLLLLCSSIRGWLCLIDVGKHDHLVHCTQSVHAYPTLFNLLMFAHCRGLRLSVGVCVFGEYV